jgi:hypothetical protein
MKVTNKIYQILAMQKISYYIFCGGMLLRIIYALTLKDPKNSGPDSVKYVNATLDLINEGFFSNTENLRLFAPGYSIFMMPVYFFGDNLSLLIIFLQAIIFLISTYLLHTTVALKYGNFPANITSTLLIYTPIMIDSTTSIMYEAVAISLSILWIRTLIVAMDFNDQIPRKTVLMICILSFSFPFLHPRFIGLSLIFSILVYFFIEKKIGVIAVFFAFLAPLLLSMRNLVATKSFYTAGNTGVTFATGTHVDWNANWEILCPNLVGVATKFTQDWDDIAFKCGVRIIKEDPLRWISLIPRKTLEHFEPFVFRFGGAIRFEDVLFTGPTVLQTLWLLLFILVMWISAKALFVNEKTKHLAWSFVASTVWLWLVSVLFFGYARYRVVALPFLYFGIAMALVKYFGKKGVAKID